MPVRTPVDVDPENPPPATPATPTPSYTPRYPFTLYQHKLVFDPPLDYIVSKYKLLADFAEYSPFFFNGSLLFMTQVIPKGRVGCFGDPMDSEKCITWSVRFVGKVSRNSPMYRHFKELIFMSGVTLGVFNLENLDTNYCRYKFEKKFNAFSTISFYTKYKTTIRFLLFKGEIMYCSEFLAPGSPTQKITLVPNSEYCVNAKEHLLKIFETVNIEEQAMIAAEQYFVGKKVLAAPSGKIYQIAQLDWKTMPTGTFKDRQTGENITYVDHYKNKYGIEIPDTEKGDIMIVAFPSKNEDIRNGKLGNVCLPSHLCYALKEWVADRMVYE